MAICGNCGGDPVGEACYHICPNSNHYYSPERERYDDQFYGDDDNRERYAATIESMQYEDEDEPWREELATAVEAELDSLCVTVSDTDDIPF